MGPHPFFLVFFGTICYVGFHHCVSYALNGLSVLGILCCD